MPARLQAHPGILVGITESSGSGASHCPALPAPRGQLAYKRAGSSVLLTGIWRAGGGTMDVISVQQLVRTWEEGYEGSQSSGYPQTFSAK